MRLILDNLKLLLSGFPLRKKRLDLFQNMSAPIFPFFFVLMAAFLSGLQYYYLNMDNARDQALTCGIETFCEHGSKVLVSNLAILVCSSIVFFILTKKDFRDNFRKIRKVTYFSTLILVISPVFHLPCVGDLFWVFDGTAFHNWLSSRLVLGVGPNKYDLFIIFMLGISSLLHIFRVISVFLLIRDVPGGKLLCWLMPIACFNSWLELKYNYAMFSFCFITAG